jgi:NAD(P)-dependent dehydrogenase (short-subunit alcohol dehydrogenase family)
MADSPSSREFSGKRIVIVGAASGHGERIARSFSEAGAQLVLLDRDARVEALAEELGADDVVCDVRDAGGIAALVARIGAPVGGLVYLPRARIRKPFAEITADDFQEELDVSLRGLLLLAQQLAPALARSADHHPFIVAVSSVLSHVIGTESVSYHVAKAGLDQLVRYLAVELGPQRIRVNAVAPGWVTKDEHQERFQSAGNAAYRAAVEAYHPVPAAGDSGDVYEAIAFLASPRAKFITGQVLHVDGGVTLREPSHFWFQMRQRDGR